MNTGQRIWSQERRGQGGGVTVRKVRAFRIRVRVRVGVRAIGIMDT